MYSYHQHQPSLVQTAPQSGYYHQNLGTAGHRASSSLSYIPSYSYAYPQQYQQYPPIQDNVNVSATAANTAAATAAAAAAANPAESNGGISPVLEYNIDNMATFLSWCTFGMLKQNRNPTKEFDNLVVSVLFATRLPKSTIIIALEYMNQRYSSAVLGNLSETEIFTVLIIALILANKFNDDNTFTNRSWCGAAGLSLEVVNAEEKLWLEEVRWQLNVVNFESNIRTLEECWTTWLEKYTVKTTQPQIGSQLAAASPAVVSPSSQNYYNTNQATTSIPSSPILHDYTAPTTNYYSPVVPSSSPIKYAADSIWSYVPQQQQQQQPLPSTNSANIWSYTPPAYQYTAPHVASHVSDPYSAGFVGYSNPYYYNMASC
ncbi:hypothetical protein CAAN1_05S06832 [[Candida] anglica]|uniref:Cyclin N-terminal domain-containing protein n=1 Tax=[Candida] anglica TaxID=148631 RepID=A0ABP0EFU1_9ASCO